MKCEPRDGIASPGFPRYASCVRAGFAACAAIGLTVAGCSFGLRSTIDLNSAPASRLETLPGIDERDAERIVAARPYLAKEDLVARRVITREQYDDVADAVYLGPPGIPDYLDAVPPSFDGP